MISDKKVWVARCEMLDGDEFDEYINKTIVPNNPIRPRGLSMKFPYDLRASQSMKEYDSSTHTRWTAFLNNSGTLCHVVCPEKSFMLRIIFMASINSLPMEKQRRIIIQITKGEIDLDD